MAFWTPFFKIINKLLVKGGRAIDDLVFGDVHDQQKQLKEAAEANQAAKMTAWNDAQRRAAMESEQRRLQAEELSDSSRAGAIQNFQAESSGEAMLAGSGLAGGSSPYAALESSVSEMNRNLRGGVARGISSFNLSAQSSGMALEQADLVQREYEARGEQIDDQMDDYGLRLMGAGINAMLSMYSITSSVKNILGSFEAQGTSFGELLLSGQLDDFYEPDWTLEGMRSEQSPLVKSLTGQGSDAWGGLSLDFGFRKAPAQIAAPTLSAPMFSLGLERNKRQPFSPGFSMPQTASNPLWLLAKQ